MLSRVLQVTSAAVCSVALFMQAGCACQAKGCVTKVKAPCEPVARGPCERIAGEVAAELPPNARPGECYAKVWIPPEFKTVSERVCVREASERLEVIPAKYEWVEEKVMVKEASKTLDVEPAEYATREHTIQTDSGHTDWEINKDPLCKNKTGEPARDVYCLVNHPPAQRTVRTECMVKPARVKETCIPAQYETVKRERLASPATTKRVTIPAQYDTVEKTVKVCDGRMSWQRVTCDRDHEPVAINDSATPPAAAPVILTTPTPVKVAPRTASPRTATVSAKRSHRR